MTPFQFHAEVPRTFAFKFQMRPSAFLHTFLRYKVMRSYGRLYDLVPTEGGYRAEYREIGDATAARTCLHLHKVAEGFAVAVWINVVCQR